MALQDVAAWERGGHRYRRSHRRGPAGRSGESLAMMLGLFSVGLGVAELAAPRGLAKMIGVADDERNCNLLRFLGLREITSGVGILTQPRPAGWMWSRVGGDAMDLALLGAALASDRSEKSRVAAATAAVLGVAALDALCGTQLSGGDGTAAQTSKRAGMLARFVGAVPTERGIRVHKAITVGKPAEELYRFWRDFENLPRFMRYLQSVRTLGDRRSHWVARAPMGRVVEWDAEVTDDRPNERIAWRSLPGAEVDNRGRISFEAAPGGRGTVVRVELEYEAPAGMMGAAIAKLLGHEPGQQVQEDLRRFKQVMEVGEVVQSEATVKGGGPARPSEHAPATSSLGRGGAR